MGIIYGANASAKVPPAKEQKQIQRSTPSSSTFPFAPAFSSDIQFIVSSTRTYLWTIFTFFRGGINVLRYFELYGIVRFGRPHANQSITGWPCKAHPPPTCFFAQMWCIIIIQCIWKIPPQSPEDAVKDKFSQGGETRRWDISPDCLRCGLYLGFIGTALLFFPQGTKISS